LDPTLNEPQPGYTVYDLPGWAALHYPADWVRAYLVPGGIHLASEEYHMYSTRAPTAEFQIRPVEQLDPLVTLLEEVDIAMNEEPEGARVLEEPRTITVNGQVAATAVLSLPRTVSTFDSDTDEQISRQVGWLLARITVIQGPDSLATVRATCYAEHQDTYEPIFDTMLESIVIREGPTDPVIGDSSDPEPAGYITYSDQASGIRILHPSHWVPQIDSGGLHLRWPSGEELDSTSRGEVVAVDKADDLLFGNPPVRLEELVPDYLLQIGYSSGLFYDAVLVTNVITATEDDQSTARALFSATLSGEPALGIINLIHSGDRVVVALAYVREQADLAELQRIVDTMAFADRDGDE
jgi:hypothetical protein